MSIRKMIAGVIAGNEFHVISVEKMEEYKHAHRIVTSMQSEDQLIAGMMNQQKELYTLNGFPMFDFTRPLGLRAKNLITENIAWFTKSAIHECVELDNWTQWKPWSQRLGNKWEGDRWSAEHMREMRMEVIDLLAFVFNLCCLLGIDWKMLCAMYTEKMRVNVEERHQSGKY